MLALPSFTAARFADVAQARDRVYCCDLLSLCDALPDQSIDMILADLPYGTTACAWDTVIPFEPMWARFKRVIKPRGAIVLTASQPFTSALVMSNPAMFRYEWVWEKDNGTNFLNLEYGPFKVHENVLVFSDSLVSYQPQMASGRPYQLSRGMVYRSYLGAQEKGTTTINSGERHPRSVIKFNQQRGDHPTQKPVDLFRYLIRTYTQPGDTVLDPVVGSGTTAIAAREEQRRFICGDSSPEYVAIAQRRLAAPYTLPMFEAVRS